MLSVSILPALASSDDHDDHDDDGQCNNPSHPKPVITIPSCPFDQIEGRTIVEFDTASKIRSDRTLQKAQSGPVSTVLSAAKYAVTLFSFDGYKNRVNKFQPNESWYVIFNNGGTEIASSSPISDLEDYVKTASLSEQVDDLLTIPQNADSVTAFHAVYPDLSSPNSVVPICAAFDFIEDLTPPEPEIPYAPYCGDGEINQDWEQCDGSQECTYQCQFTNNTECTDLTLARVNIESAENWGSGNMTSNIFLGSATNKIPQGMWFPLYLNGSYFIDSDMTGSYDDVPGLSIERHSGAIRALLYGSHPERTDKEHIRGNIEFSGVTVTNQASDLSGNNLLENAFDGIKKKMIGQDEVWISTSTMSNFWLTVSPADDGFFTHYTEPNQCEIVVNKPIITLLGDNPIDLTVGDTFTDPGATASDEEDGDLTSSIVVGGDTVATSTAGTYVITYNVTDSDSNAADEVTRTVNVNEDSGGGGEPPAKCADGIDNDEDGLSDIDDPACHSDGDASNTDSYDPTIDTENSVPVITLLGDNPIDLTVGDTFTDPGATASDEEDGDLTSSIVVGGDTVATSTAGTYVITYNVTDSASSSAPEVTRAININETTNGNGGGGNGSGNGGGGSGGGSGDGNGPSTGAGGGGGGVIPGLIGSSGGGSSVRLSISNEKIVQTATNTASVSWETNLQSTSQVKYGIKSAASSTPPFFEYSFTSDIASDLKTNHRVVISGLLNNFKYYLRPVSTRQNENAYGNELSFTLSDTFESIPGEEISECSQYILDYIKLGEENDTNDVTKLQTFLRDEEGFKDINISGVYDDATADAVAIFQLRYKNDILEPWGIDEPTKYVYYTTRKKINEIHCKTKDFPLTLSQLTEIDDYKLLIGEDASETDLGTVGLGTGGGDGVLADSESGKTKTDELDSSFASIIEATEGLLKRDKEVATTTAFAGFAGLFSGAGSNLPVSLPVLVVLITFVAVILSLTYLKRRKSAVIKTPKLDATIDQ